MYGRLRKKRLYKIMLLVVEKTYFKAIVIKIGLFFSEIVDERHFSTEKEAEEFKILTEIYFDNLKCVICKM